MCCAPAEPMRCGAPSTMRTRVAGKRATSRPLVPLRQLTRRHLAPSSIVRAATDLTSGTWRKRGRPRPATGKTNCTSAGQIFWCLGMPTAQQSPLALSACRNGVESPYLHQPRHNRSAPRPLRSGRSRRWPVRASSSLAGTARARLP